MRFRASIVRIAIASLPTAVACDGGTAPKTDTKATDAKPTTDVKTDPVRDAKIDTKVETKVETKVDTKVETKPDTPPEPRKPDIVITRPEDIPTVPLAGAPMPYTPPPPPPSAPAKAAEAAPAAPSPAAPAPAPVVAQAAAITIRHEHAPGEPCTQLTREEVEKALADLRK